MDVLNNDPLTMAVIEIRGFIMGTAGPKIPFVHEIFTLDPSTKIQKTYSVSGFEDMSSNSESQILTPFISPFGQETLAGTYCQHNEL